MGNYKRVLLLTVFSIIAVMCSVFYAEADERLNARILRAASEGNAAAVADCLFKGAFIDTRDKMGNTPLILAADAGYQEVVRVLLNGNASVNAVNIYGYYNGRHSYYPKIYFKLVILLNL